MNIDKPQRGVAVKIGRKMRGYQGCQQVHFLYPDLEPSYALKELNDRWEDGYEIFLPSQEEREERCARCGIGVIVLPAIVLSLGISQYEEWTLDTLPGADRGNF